VEGKVFANLMVRSLLDSGTWMLAREVESLFGLAGFAVEMEGGYPGWAPNPQSPLLALFQQVYTQEFGGQSGVQVIHAGLECGIIGAKYPAWTWFPLARPFAGTCAGRAGGGGLGRQGLAIAQGRAGCGAACA
jgi:di/tripeptidase